MPVSEVFQLAGGVTALARALGLHHTSPREWKRVPAERVFAVAKIINVPVARLRPDLFGDVSAPKEVDPTVRAGIV